MASLPIYQPLLNATDDDDDAAADDHHNHDLVPSAGERGGRPIVRSRSATTRQINSLNTNGNGGGGSVRLRRGTMSDDSSSGELMQASSPAGNNNNNKARKMKRCQTAPGYVSFEDVIGGEELFGRRGRGTWRPPEEETGVISDPLVRTASRLYALADTSDRHQPPRHRRTSPGPLGTRRGSAMYWLAKKYVSPCLGFLAGAIFCGSAASGACPI
ncbi:hypothetical protein QOZ80_4AG0318310 [Eleusine coracana subsp. coracana]|nr:hypothetical protein QOZ80_4AG0318310 [Eleusine coracana subsp. coracana]